MRKILLSLLLATTVATPALAERPDRGDRGGARPERSESRSQDRQDRSEARQRSSEASEARTEVRVERPQGSDNRAQVSQPQFDAQQTQGGGQQVREVVRQRVSRDNRPVMPAANVNERGRPTLGQQQDVRENVNNWRGDRDAAQQQVEQRAQRNRVRVPNGARPDRPAPPPQTANNNARHPTWHTDWRRDHRYDWRDHRRNHRSIFHLGFYFDPFGWGYHRYNIGWRLWPSYYSSNYWLNDPYMYRLPYAPWPYKWVRYYDDALLVNTYTGQVVDVIYDFFW